ncbi:holin [Salinicoccus siamensis]|uniref:Holin n=1 Tax=Salinicoccus siamensis TaxID=381830 RepID=A0ABV5Z450_9STAP
MMEGILLFSGVIASITLGLVEVLKRTQKIKKNFLPLVSVTIGAGLGALSALVPELGADLSMGGRVSAGLISGLMATGAWEVAKRREGFTTDTLK